MRNPLESAAADPWGTMNALLDGPLHPGGVEATERLLDRADVGAGTRLLDVGCGAGESLAVARDRGATAIGVDETPRTGDAVAAEMTDLPVADGAVDVVLAECVLCLSADYPEALAEARRVLRPGGRLAFSDIVVDGEAPDVPAAMADALCLTGHRDRSTILENIETARFDIERTRGHREDLLAMRDELAGTVDYEGLLGLLGERGQRALDGIETLESAVESGRIDYVSVVAEAV
jgi:SAM-dependent methyltransferase